MIIPKRVEASTGKHALVDGIPFVLPVRCIPSPVLMALYPIDADKARAYLPAEVHPMRLWNKGLLVITVINYLGTNIGTYIEYSIAIACTHGLKPAPRLLPAVFMKHYGTGQYVMDLPVSTDISVKGGKGIWGMPKHRASLNFEISDHKVSSQYDLDGKLATYIEIEKPGSANLPVNAPAVNYCAFRGMLTKSYIYIKGKAGLHWGNKAKGRLVVGDHPRVQWMKQLDVADKPLATAFIPGAVGTLDDHFECWFLSQAQKIAQRPPGFETVIDLPLSEEWPPAPTAPVPKE